MQRLNLAKAAMKEGKRAVYGNRTIPLARRTILFQANVMSTLLFGAGVWPELGEGDFRLFHSGAMSLFRQVLAIPRNACQRWSTAEIQGALDLPSPQVLLYVERLRVLPLLVKTGPDPLWGLVRHDDAFLSGMRRACQWLFSHVRSTSTLPHPDVDWSSWLSFISMHTGKWKGLIKRACRLSVLAQRLRALRDVACRAAWDPADSAEDIVEDDCQHACLVCKKSFGSFQRWGAHVHRSHGYVAPSTAFARGRRCVSCGTTFSSNAKLRKHLQHFRSCLFLYESGVHEFAEVIDEGHEQAPALHCGSFPAIANIPEPVHQPFLDLSEQERPTTVAALFALACRFVAPFPLLKHTLSMWLPESDLVGSQQDASDLLQRFRPSALGCASLVQPDRNLEISFRPLLKPFPLSCSFGSGVLCGGVPPDAWLQGRGLRDEFLCSFSFWDRWDVEEISAFFVRFPSPSSSCNTIWDFNFGTLRQAHAFLKWSAQVHWLIGRAIGFAYRGAAILLEFQGLQGVQLEPFYSWCLQCGAVPDHSLRAPFVFHF